MTATLDLLEHRGWIRRVPNPDDRRSVLIEITPDGRAVADQLLPGIRTVERRILSALAPDERAHLLDMLAKILARSAEVAAEPPEPLNGQRIRPARLTPRQDAEPGPPPTSGTYTAAPQRHGRRTPRNPSHAAAHATIPGPRCT